MLSVIIPTYKPGAYVEQCLQSVFGQTLTPDHYEVIIILNGDRDPYYDWLNDYIATQAPHGLATHLLYSATPGVSNARNCGIEAAQGDHLIFLDDDDWLSPCYLEELHAACAEGTIVVANAISFNETSGKEEDNFLTNAFRQATETLPTPEGGVNLTKSRRFLSVIVAKSIPRSMIADHRFSTKFRLGEDSLFMTALTNNLQHLRFTSPASVYYIRKRNTSASRSSISFRKQVHNSLALTGAYIRLYMKDARGYDALFFLTRIAASLRKMLAKKYRTI